jgi:glycosyltransferase involved in cell wall biosynthesis
VAIPTYGREEILCRTIQEIFKQSILPDEFVIIDQSEHHLPETVEFIEECAKSGRLRWIKHHPPSQSGARNRAVMETTSEIIVFLDDDVTTHADFLSVHLKNYADPQGDAVAGQVRTKDHRELTDRMPEGIDLTEPEDVICRMPMTYNQRV